MTSGERLTLTFTVEFGEFGIKIPNFDHSPVSSGKNHLKKKQAHSLTLAKHVAKPYKQKSKKLANFN